MMRGYLLNIWSLVDPLYFKCTRLEYLNDVRNQENILRVRLTRYKGRPVVLTDGTEVAKNDFLVKIHLHNVRLLHELKEVNSDITRGRIIYNQVKSSLPDVKDYIEKHALANEIKGIIGITLLSKGCERLGFEVHPISHPLYKFLKYIGFFPISVLSMSKLSFSKFFHQPSPHYLFMSMKKLCQLYNK
jgi:hypothetical protein